MSGAYRSIWIGANDPVQITKGRANLMTLPLKLIQNFILILPSGYSSNAKKTETEEEEGGWFRNGVVTNCYSTYFGFIRSIA